MKNTLDIKLNKNRTHYTSAKDVESFNVYGQTDFPLQYISEKFTGEVQYDQKYHYQSGIEQEQVDNKEYNMKLFNLEEALAGKPVVTRDGRKVSEIFITKTANRKPLLAVIEGNMIRFNEDGTFRNAEERSYFDLFMVIKKKTVWVNLYKRNSDIIEAGSVILHDSEESALKYMDNDNNNHNHKYLGTFPIEVEV